MKDRQNGSEAERALLGSRQRYERMANTVPVMLYDSVLAPDGTNRYINVAPEPCREILELNPDDLLKDMSLVWNIIHPDDLTRFHRKVLAANEAGEFLTEVRIITPSGALKWLLVNSKPNPAESGETVVWSGYLQDITERKQVEDALRESEATFRKLFEDSSDSILLIDSNGGFVECNQAALDHLKMTKEQFVSMSPVKISPEFQPNGRPSAAAAQEMIALAYSQGLHRFDWTHVNFKGGEFVVEVSLMPITIKGETMLHTAWRDITARKQNEEQRQQLELQLHQKHKMEAIGFMAGGMAHNFNNNLSIILGNLELSQLKTPKDSEIIPLLENAKIAVRRSRDLVLKIITYSRKGIQDKAFIHLSDVIHETMALLQSTLPATINLQQEINPESLSNVINADPSQIQEVLINLCNNAVHAMNEQGDLKILLDTVELTADDIPAQYEAIPGSYAKLSIQDAGHGIPAEMLDKIFDPFYSTKAEHEGAGMGLATVQGIVAQHGGIIIVNSIPNQATVFDLYFPITEEAATEPKTINTDLPKGTEKILFIDDDEMLAKLGEKLLSEMGYQVSLMTESTEALKMFTANPDHFDLVITDQTMPQLSGKELIQKLKKIRPDLRTVLCTGFSSQIDEDQAQQLGIGAFCMKPLDLPEFLQTVRRVLDGDKDE